jgi:hypothetical protein
MKEEAMSEREESKRRESAEESREAVDPTTGEVCADINDPIRRALCKVCGMPVVGQAPFCQEHEPPVP